MNATLSTFDSVIGTEIFAGIDDTITILKAEVAGALDQAFWTFDFQGELEEALDAALLRATLAVTPTLSSDLFAFVAA
jgi:hypothetical protein